MARNTKNAKNQIGKLDADAVSRLVEASSDIALVLDDAGTIIEVVAQANDLAVCGAGDWLGRPWVQTVTAESRQKVEALLRDAQAAADAAGRWRHVNHPVKDGDDLPLLYSALRVASDASNPAKGRIVAFGRDLRDSVALQRRLIESQQALERDYWRYREAETRYRHLYETTSEAVLIVDGATQKVVEANPAARALCASRRTRLVGATLASLFESIHAERLQSMVAAARSVGRQDLLRAQLVTGGAEVSVSASAFRQDDTAFVLVRLAPVRAESPAQSARRRAGEPSAPVRDAGVEPMLQAYLRGSPDGLVFCNEAGRVLSANRAFVTLVQLSAEEQVRGQPLDRWVGRSGVELGVLIATLRQRGSVGLFVTTVRGDCGGRAEVEIAATVLALSEEPVLAFAVRDIERRLKPASKSASTTMSRSAAELAELVGHTPLKVIISETSDLIEQLCIQTALDMTGDNRASAALLLGLSRQSLYVKLRRYGMVSANVDEVDA
jgi:transcriptional regulator PpsR